NQLNEIGNHKLGLDQFEAHFWNMLCGPPIEARPVGPCDPRLPKPRDNPLKGPVRTDIFQEADGAASLYDPAELLRRGRLLGIRQNAEQKASQPLHRMNYRENPALSHPSAARKPRRQTFYAGYPLEPAWPG